MSNLAKLPCKFPFNRETCIRDWFVSDCHHRQLSYISLCFINIIYITIIFIPPWFPPKIYITKIMYLWAIIVSTMSFWRKGDVERISCDSTDTQKQSFRVSLSFEESLCFLKAQSSWRCKYFLSRLGYIQHYPESYVLDLHNSYWVQDIFPACHQIQHQAKPPAGKHVNGCGWLRHMSRMAQWQNYTGRTECDFIGDRSKRT